MHNRVLLAACVAAFVASCASGYKSIRPHRLPYSNGQTTEGLTYSYQYNVLHGAGNKRYAKNELKRDVRLAAIQFINNTGKTIIPSKDVEFLAGGEPIHLMEPTALRKQLRQSVPVYLLYLLLTPLNFTKYEEINGVKTNSSTIPVGIVVGPGLAFVNMAAAGTANNKLQKELEGYSPDKPLPNGDTAYAFVGFRSAQYSPLFLKIKE